MDVTIASIRQDLAHALARVRIVLMLRQAARLLALSVASAAAGVLLAVLFVMFLPWLLFGSVWQGALFACVLAGITGAGLGAWCSQRNWSWPNESDCALALESQGSDASLPTAVVLSADDQFNGPVLRKAQEALLHRSEIRLGAAVSTPRLVAAPLLALCAAVALVAAGGLPQRFPSLPASADAKHVAAPSLNSTVSASDLDAFQKGLNERQQQSALKQAASDLRDESKSQAERQQSLDHARAEVAKAKAATAGEIPENVPASRAERETLAGKLEQAAAAAGARAEAVEKGKSAATTDSGGTVKEEGPAKREMRPAPVYEPRRFENAGESLSDQTQERRAVAQAAVDALAKIKQGQ